AGLPGCGFGSALGQGAGGTLDGLHRCVPAAQATAYAFNLRPGTDVAAEVRHLDRVLAGSSASPTGAVLSPRLGDQLDNLSKIQGLLLAMAGLNALTTLAALTNLLVTSVRRRRR